VERVRIKDVAAAAGVSVATVSRALTGARSVRAEHKAAVEEAAQRLGYHPHAIAQALRESRTRAIGMVVPRIDNPFFPQLVQAAEERLQREGLTLLLCSAADDAVVEAARVRMLVDRRVDGLLISATSRAASVAAIRDATARIPVVQFDQFAPDAATPFVGVDDAGGIDLATAALVSAGCTRLAYIGGSDSNWSGWRRLEGFRSWADQHDPVALGRVRTGEFTRAFGREAALDLLEQDDIDGVVCGNDLIAIGVLDAAEELGRSVPDDLAVSGFDDISVATVSRPALTTIAQPTTDVIESAIDLLLALIDDPAAAAQGGPAHLELPVFLVERGTVRQSNSPPAAATSSAA
jgi:LacI family transcriptional regulator